MNQKELFRYAAGYLFGGLFFLIIIPGFLYFVNLYSGSIFTFVIFDDERIKVLIALILFIPGIVFMAWSNSSLFFVGKGGPAEGFGVEISPKTKNLVSTGPYRYTRNPMVFGAYSIYLALAVFFNSFSTVIIVLLFLPVIIIYLKKSEEKRLIKDFGEDYLKYRDRVSLLIPLPRKNNYSS